MKIRAGVAQPVRVPVRMVNSNGSSIEGNTHNLEVVGSKPTPGITILV